MSKHSISPVWYEPHPVTPERKAELRAQGYRIIDAQFAPADAESIAPREDGPTVEEFVQAGYQAANYPPSGYASRSTPEEIAAAIEAQAAAKGEGKMTAAGMKAALDAKGIAYKASASKADLAALLETAPSI